MVKPNKAFKILEVVTEIIVTGGVKWRKYQQEKGEALGNTALK